MIKINGENLPMSTSKVLENHKMKSFSTADEKSPLPILERPPVQKEAELFSSPRHSDETQVDSKTSVQQSQSTKSNFKFFERVRKIKHIEIYAAVAVILIMVAIYASNFINIGGSSQYNATRVQNESFAREIEARLVATLSQVQGAGRVDAMVTVVGSTTREIAYNEEERTVTQGGANGATNTTTTIIRTPIIVNGQPLTILEIKPQIKGVVIVAQGASDLLVRMNILRAVQALIADNSVRIEILAGR